MPPSGGRLWKCCGWFNSTNRTVKQQQVKTSQLWFLQNVLFLVRSALMLVVLSSDIVHDRVVHLVLLDEDVSLQYFIPAVA